MNIIQKLCMAVMFSVCSFLGAKAEGKALFIEGTDGSKTAFVLSEKPEVTFVGKVLRVSVNGKNTDFEISGVKQFRFNDAATDIEMLKADDTKIFYQLGDKVIIEGIRANVPVQLYSVSGTLLKGRVSFSDDHAEVSFTSLPKGIYLIKISNQQTIKIYRK